MKKILIPFCVLVLGLCAVIGFHGCNNVQLPAVTINQSLRLPVNGDTIPLDVRVVMVNDTICITATVGQFGITECKTLK